MAKERIILGVDPGTQIMGYGVIKVVGNKPGLLCLDIIKLNKFDDHFLRLENILNKTLQIIDEFMPDEMALEAPFYGKNVQSMLKLGRAQGVVMAAGLSRKIPVCEYLPKKVKQSITGNGNASKEQVAAMLQRIFNFKTTPKYLDATDGLAVAVCHFFQQGAVSKADTPAQKPKTSGGKRNTWEQFVKNNPGKLG